MQVLKQVGWWTYAVLAIILTLGIWARVHLVTVRMRTLGGVRAGVLGGTHVYTEVAAGTDFLVISTWHGKDRFPVRQIANANTGPLRVSVESSGGKTDNLATWTTRSVAAFVNAQVSPRP